MANSVILNGMAEQQSEENRTCFVASPIGEEGSDTRRAADTLFDRLIKPVAEAHNLEAIRADHIKSPGQITFDILGHLTDSRVVIADLAGLNANVFYEVAYRHSVGLPCILLSPRGLKSPFDLKDTRTIEYDISDWNGLDEATTALNECLRGTLEGGECALENPISMFRSLRHIEYDDTLHVDPMKQLVSRVNAFLGQLDDRLEGLEVPANADWRTNAEYIDGQDDAFAALTEATKNARHSVRSSRFFPASIQRRPDYLSAIEERVRGSFGRPPVEDYRRIISVNNPEKKTDVMQHLINFQGKPFTLFLTTHENTFELVVIDDTDVFIHFSKEELVIASTLHLRGRRIAERFSEVFDQLAVRDLKAKFDCREINENSLHATLTQVEEIFKKIYHRPESADKPEGSLEETISSSEINPA